MKKNVMMRIASFLLIAVLLTTCAISGTYAKYVTSISGQDSARVARWGFTGENSDVKFDNLFLNTYDSTVKGESNAIVIAPGTSGRGTFQFDYSAGDPAVTKPEVAYTLTVSTNGSSIADDIKSNTNIQWAVLPSTELVGDQVPDGQWGTWDAMIAELQGLDGDENFDPGELALIANQEYTVAWRWVFANTPEVDAEDITDTALGNKGTLDPVTLKITITATQID